MGNYSKPKEELLSFLTTWLNLRGIMLNKKRKEPKDKYP